MTLTFPRLIAAAFAVLLQAGAAHAASERHTVFISDLHLGAGRDAQQRWIPTEDFRWQPEFDAFLAWLSRRTGDRAELVFTGDTFELWQSPTMECSSDINKPGCKVADCHETDTEIGCTEAEAQARLRVVLKAHDDFVMALRAFAAKGSNRVVFVPGNHDAALLFPAVAQQLLGTFNSPGITLSRSGSWLSTDGLVYADHGHQWDLLNRFAYWPQPFVQREGTQHLAKPWGENMVQQFYNQYEAVFPIIDNLSKESAGVQYAIEQAGLAAAQDAVGRFFRFFLFQQSTRQAMVALGKDGHPAWDGAAVRQRGADFFIDTLADPTLLAAARAAQKAGTLTLEASRLSDDEIDVICTARQQLRDARPCPVRQGQLGAALVNTVFGDTLQRAAYLRDLLPRVKRPDEPWPAAYVAGHSHTATAPERLPLGEMPDGLLTLQYANTGAFQRVASPEQIQAILAGPAKDRAKSPLDLQPEDLPPCYNFVWVEPYTARPQLKLWRWAAQAGDAAAQPAKFEATVGTCLSRPL